MLKTPWIALLTPLMVSTLACGGDAGRENSSVFSNDEGLTNNGIDDDDDTDTADEGNDDGQIKLDTVGDDEGRSSADDGGGEQGCKAIDFLFVIDNSGSMGDNQSNLVSSFPGFIQKIQATVADVDSYHIMVVKTDEKWNDCTVECSFFPGLCQFGNINGCDGAPSVCDNTLGAGVNFPIGNDASNQYCNLTGGQRFITPSEPFDLLANRFTCIAKVGTDGSGSERQIESLSAALNPAINGPGGCNSGFLRDDAVLVITIITDEEDSHSPGTPAAWIEHVVAQKGGDSSGIVVLGLINDTDAVSPVCGTESQDPAKIREFVEGFPNRILGSVCEANYAPFFDQAVDLIDTTCDEFDPIG